LKNILPDGYYQAVLYGLAEIQIPGKRYDKNSSLRKGPSKYFNAVLVLSD
jgi:hypothetical protein